MEEALVIQSVVKTKLPIATLAVLPKPKRKHRRKNTSVTKETIEQIRHQIGLEVMSEMFCGDLVLPESLTAPELLRLLANKMK